MKTKVIRNDINILYSIGAILAVFGHSHPNNWSLFENTLFYHLIVFIYTFHMPLFFIVAGILLMNSKSIENQSYFSFIKGKAIKLLTPYFVLTTVFLIPKGFIEHGGFNFLNLKYIFKVYFSPRDNTWGHFWFLPVLFVLYVILGAVKKLLVKNSAAIFVLFAINLLAVYLYLFPIKTDYFGLEDISNNLFYMVLGMLLTFAEEEVKLHKAVKIIFAAIFTAIAVALYLLSYQIFNKLIGIFMIFALILFAKAISNYNIKFFGFISKNIFTIYIYSWIFQSFTLIVLERLNITWQIISPIMFLVGIALPLLLIYVYNKLKFLNCRFLDLVIGKR